jgi:hypothetical protein
MREHEARRRYFIELSSAMMLYMGVLVGSILLAKRMDDSLARTLLLLSPVVPLLLSLWAIVRQFARMDEFVRLRSLESFAIAGAVTAGLSFTYGFLESAGLPRLSMFWVWGVMGISWGVIAMLRNLCQK